MTASEKLLAVMWTRQVKRISTFHLSLPEDFTVILQCVQNRVLPLLCLFVDNLKLTAHNTASRTAKSSKRDKKNITSDGNYAITNIRSHLLTRKAKRDAIF